jgi:hypothetical protein
VPLILRISIHSLFCILAPGYWRGFDFEGVENRYLGVTFVDADDNRYYGWVRCSTADSMKAITIHEYAFENIPNKPIIAGSSSTSSYIDINNIYDNDITIWNLGSTIYYTVPDVQEGVIQVYNSVGAIIHETKLLGVQGSFELGDVPKGVYIVKLKDSLNYYKVII